MFTEKLKAADIEYLEDISCIIQHWKGYSISNEFRDVINQTIKIFQGGKRFTKIISDSLLLGVVKKEDTDWIAYIANPILIKNGLEKIAFIVPKNVFAQMSVDNYNKESKGTLAIKYFQTMLEAKSWMK